MTDPPPPLRGTGVVSVVSDAAIRVVAGLVGTPTLLVMVLLNIALIGAAAWYLQTLEGYRHIERLETIKFFAACMKGGPLP
jgi:hypothetical protein